MAGNRRIPSHKLGQIKTSFPARTEIELDWDKLEIILGHQLWRITRDQIQYALEWHSTYMGAQRTDLKDIIPFLKSTKNWLSDWERLKLEKTNIPISFSELVHEIDENGDKTTRSVHVGKQPIEEAAIALKQYVEAIEGAITDAESRQNALKASSKKIGPRTIWDGTVMSILESLTWQGIGLPKTSWPNSNARPSQTELFVRQLFEDAKITGHDTPERFHKALLRANSQR